LELVDLSDGRAVTVADSGFIESEIKSLPVELRAKMLRIFRAFLKDIRFGHPTGDVPDPMVNMAGGFYHGTTPATPGNEFTIAHGFGRVPYLAVPVLRLDAVGSSLVSLTVSRAADDKRVYFTSTEASAPVSLAIEG
jgi:hypothetical protein